MTKPRLILPILAQLSERITQRTDGHKVLVISGPGGVGKGTIIDEIIRRYSPLIYFSVSATTRQKRKNERNGVHYDFMNPTQFAALNETDGFFESKEVHGNWYGTPRAPIIEALRSGKLVIIECDVEGSRELRKQMPHACFTFLTTNYLTLVKRLKDRRKETSESVAEAAIRLKNSWAEVEKAQTLFTDDEHIQSSTFDNLREAVMFDADQVMLRLEKHAGQHWVQRPVGPQESRAHV